ncbi:endo-1,4-beta-xylanase [Sphingomonas lenta]|uniref:Beta-xylanase n=1 Tax=Sphingomonas lenta TaxID=1141887 RepID=A0A2A2SBW4_9SPHN|nr:endo-1,4-beta-xylanase [Sphingomonas lenta]PAX06748.1 glycosyl hydrolase [Sphingomonas lenta]
MTDIFSRRRALALMGGAAASLVGGCAADRARPASAPLMPPSLDTVARAKGMRFGSAVAWRPRNSEAYEVALPLDAALLDRECGILVPENEMKWVALRPSPTRFSFVRFDAMLAYAEANGIAMRGHTLLWHQPKWMPRWANEYDFGANPRAEGERLLVEHVRTVCERYGARVGAYDVVNETVNPADGGLYDTALSRAIGGTEATVDLAFRTARAAAPHAQLVYNDYMSWEPGNERHRAGVLRLLEGFRRRGTPVDALGVQSHLITQGSDGPGALQLQRDWRAFLDAVVAMEYKLVITELDVRDNNLPADIAVRDRAVADYTRAYLDVMFSYPQLRDVLVWGMSDRYSWIEGFEPRPDGAPRRPTVYDAQFRPKPMRAAIADAFAAAPPR